MRKGLDLNISYLHDVGISMSDRLSIIQLQSTKREVRQMKKLMTLVIALTMTFIGGVFAAVAAEGVFTDGNVVDEFSARGMSQSDIASRSSKVIGECAVIAKSNE